MSAAEFRDRVRARAGRVELLLFRVGQERFALELASVDEAVDLAGAGVHDVPARTAALLGVVALRGALMPLYDASVPLRVGASAATTALLFRDGGTRVAVAVDDADDVLAADLADVRPAPHEGGDSLVLGVLQLEGELVGLLDGPAFVAACRADSPRETS